MTDVAACSLFAAEPCDSAVRQSLDRLARAPDVARLAVMPDVHLAGGVCNGIVLATRRLLYPSAVGADIGCGYATMAFDAAAAPLGRRQLATALLEALPSVVPVMRHRRREGPPPLEGPLAPERLTDPSLASRASGEGRLECGTLGRGNHFLEFQQDDEGRLWLMVHSGSRAMGQFITVYHLRQARPVGSGLVALDIEEPAGQAYLSDVAWARAYAAESRRRMLTAAAALAGDLLGVEPDWSTLLNADHNHVQAESHAGETLWVHRKGANAAAEGAANVIPGSMATHTYHVTGRGLPEALASSSHGAGRRWSRGAARARIRRRDLERELAGVWFDPAITARLVDEAPSAYKDLDTVMRAQHDLVRIVRRVRPVLCYKGA